MEPIEIQNRTAEQHTQSNVEHKAYKDFCSKPPRPSDFSNDCEFWESKKEHRKQCIDMIREYDNRWSDVDRPDGHEPHIKQINREIKNIEVEIDKACR